MPEIFKIETFKHLDTDTTHEEWSNTYYVIPEEENATVELPSLGDDALHILQYERNFHLSRVVLDRAVISTYLPDRAGVNEVTRAYPFGARGAVELVLTDEMIPLTSVLAIAFSGNAGRSSIKLYRGALSDMRTERRDGKLILGAGVGQNITDMAGVALGQGGTLGRLVIPSVRDGLVYGRYVNSLVVKGIRQRQRYQKKAARLSLDGDAITKRLQNAAKELNYLYASMRAFDAFKDYPVPSLAIDALTELKKAAEPLMTTTITDNNAE